MAGASAKPLHVNWSSDRMMLIAAVAWTFKGRSGLYLSSTSPMWRNLPLLKWVGMALSLLTGLEGRIARIYRVKGIRSIRHWIRSKVTHLRSTNCRPWSHARVLMETG